MAVKKKDEFWIVDVRPGGTKGKRVIRKFRTKAEAIRFESFIIAESTAGKPWNPSQNDNRHLSELIQIWVDEHKPSITSGKKYHQLMVRFCNELEDPIACNLSTRTLSQWRNNRMDVIKSTTLNTEITTMRGLFNWLIKRNYINYTNPFKDVEKIKTQEQERPFLSKSDVKKLAEAIPQHKDRDVALIAQICLETGCRWSEAENLTTDRVAHDRITFTNTKSKKKRTIPIRRELAKELLSRPTGRLFRQGCEHTARRWLNELLDLPKGISTHILRHTFASHFVMAGGNLLTLQRILGHSKIDMTMRYAHLSPEHLEDAIKLNPIVQMER